MMLSREQVERVKEYVGKNKIRIDTLRDDVLDHICCAVEHKIAAGRTFETSLREALDELAPEGLAKLEYETILLLQSKNILMKKFMYLIGLFSSIGMTLGITFKLLHWPGADEIFNLSFLAFALLFLPLAAYNSYRLKIKRTLMEKGRIVFGFLSPAMIGLSLAMKITDLYGADVLLLAGIGVFCAGFLPCLFYSMYVRSLSIETVN